MIQRISTSWNFVLILKPKVFVLYLSLNRKLCSDRRSFRVGITFKIWRFGIWWTENSADQTDNKFRMLHRDVTRNCKILNCDSLTITIMHWLHETIDRFEWVSEILKRMKRFRIRMTHLCENVLETTSSFRYELII